MEKLRYVIEYDERVRGHLKRFPKNIRERIRTAIDERLSIEQLNYGKPLTKEWKEHRRLRVGDYRVIYKVFEERVVVFIVEVDHRKDIYQ